MPVLAGFEGQTSGATVTTANSDDFGDTAASAVDTASATVEYANDQAMRGSLALKISGSTGSGGRVTWTNPTSESSFALRTYFRMSALPSGAVQGPIFVRSSGGSVILFRWQFASAGGGRVEFITPAGTLGSFTAGMSTDTWYRLESWGTGLNGSSGVIDCALYLGDSTTPIEAAQYTSVVTTATARELRVGRGSSANIGSWWFDDVAAVFGDPTPIGPSHRVATLDLSGSGTVSHSTLVGFTGSLNLSADGSVGTAATPHMSQALGLSGAGTLTAAGVPKPTAVLNLSGTGTLGLSGTVGGGSHYSATLNLSATGGLGLTARPAFTAALGLSGAGTLAASGRPAFTGALALSGAGTLSPQGKPAMSGTLALSGAGQLSFGAPVDKRGQVLALPRRAASAGPAGRRAATIAGGER